MGSTNVSPKLRALNRCNWQSYCDVFLTAFGRRGLGESPAQIRSLQRLMVGVGEASRSGNGGKFVNHRS